MYSYMPMDALAASNPYSSIDYAAMSPRQSTTFEAVKSILTDASATDAKKAEKLLDAGLPFDMQMRVILEAATRADVSSPRTAEDLIPEFHLNFARDFLPPLKLAKFMATYEEVAVMRSPFYEGLRRHGDLSLSPLNIDPRDCRDMLEQISIERNKINEKLAATDRALIRPSLKSCTMTYFSPPASDAAALRPNFSGIASSSIVNPPSDFSYWTLEDVTFLNVSFPSSAGHFKQSKIINCSFTGDFAQLNWAAFKEAAELVNPTVTCDEIGQHHVNSGIIDKAARPLPNLPESRFSIKNIGKTLKSVFGLPRGPSSRPDSRPPAEPSVWDQSDGNL